MFIHKYLKANQKNHECHAGNKLYTKGTILIRKNCIRTNFCWRELSKLRQLTHLNSELSDGKTTVTFSKAAISYIKGAMKGHHSPIHLPFILYSKKGNDYSATTSVYLRTRSSQPHGKYVDTNCLSKEINGKSTKEHAHQLTMYNSSLGTKYSQKKQMSQDAIPSSFYIHEV